MPVVIGFCQAFLLLSTVVTAARLTTDAGGGDYFFTLVTLVLAGAAAPYLVALTVLRRTHGHWQLALGLATMLFGVGDAMVRTQAFYFPTERSGGGMALWLPLAAIIFVPLATVIIATVLGVARRGREASSERTIDTL